MSGERKKVKIKVPTKEPHKKNDLEPKPPKFPKVDDNTGVLEEEPEEDKLLREKLEATAKKIINSKSSNTKIIDKAFNTLASEIQSATGSMTSVPKPLKYLRPFYTDLRAFYLKNLNLDSNLVRKMSDVMSVLAMTMAEEGSREMLHFKLSGNREELGVWGHEFVRALCGEISEEYNSTEEENLRLSLQLLSEKIVPFLINQNTETEAVDLLFEVNKLEYLVQTEFIDKTNYERTCLYLTKFAEYVGDLNSLKKILTTTFELYLRCEDLPNALRIALFLGDKSKVEIVLGAKFGNTKQDYINMMKQLGFILGAHKVHIQNDSLDDIKVSECIENEKLSEYFEVLSQNLNMQEAKSPEDVYKTHIYGDGNSNTQSAAYNLAATYVNAFVNCGYNKDSLLLKGASEEGSGEVADWVSKNKDKGKLAAIASMGLVSLWNPENASNLVQEWFEDNNVNCYAGGLLAIGMASTGTGHFAESAFALIQDQLSNEEDEKNSQVVTRICACLGIGFTYAGNPNQEVTDFLIAYVGDDDLDPSIRFMAGFSLGLIYVGSGASEVAGDLTSCLYEFVDDEAAKQLDKPAAKFLLLGWALIYLGKQNLEDAEQRDAMENQLQAIQAIPNSVFSNFGTVLFDCCAYAGSGNVIEVQKLLRLCAETLDENGLTQEEKEEEDVENAPVQDNTVEAAVTDQEPAPVPEPDKEKVAKSSLRQSIAVLGVALITFADPVGRQMADRTFQHLLQYGELAVRRAVPLAMAFARISDPEYGQIDILSKLTHDSDLPTAMSAIFALGLISAGTTNSRVAQLLRQLAEFYKNDANVLQVVRISQGLLFAGKGLVTLHPFHSERTLMSPTAVSALLAVIIAGLDMKATLLGEYHMLLYTLALAIRPRMCLTVIDNGTGELEPVKVKVRVGQAVETVGLAGNPKKITGFQTQETPVLINVGDRVELATDEYESYTSVLEGLVVLKKVAKDEA